MYAAVSACGYAMMVDVTPEQQLEHVIQSALFAADEAALSGGYPTRAAETRAVVTAAFKLALHNRLIRINPPEDWPEYIELRFGRDD